MRAKATPSDEVTEPVDVRLNLVTAPDADLAELVALIRPGGVLVGTWAVLPV